MSELKQYIQSYFNIVNHEELDTLASLFEKQDLKKGDFFSKTGQSCNKLSFVSSGYLRIYLISDDKEITQWISKKDSFVTDLSSLIFNLPARWTIEAITDVQLYTIKKDNYLKINTLIPKWNELEKMFIAKCFTALEERIYNQLSMTAEERYQTFFEYNKEMFNQVPLQYIASMLGMTPETLSRIRKNK